MTQMDENRVVSVVGVDRVWAGHPVDFGLLTVGERQFVAYSECHDPLPKQPNLQKPFAPIPVQCYHPQLMTPVAHPLILYPRRNRHAPATIDD